MSDNVQALLSEVYHAGGRVAAVGADLAVEARRGAISSELIERIRTCKRDILCFIETRNAQLRRSIFRSRDYDPTKLTGVEKAFFLLHMLPRTVDVYNIFHHFRLKGWLDEQALARAVNDLATINEGLRTSFPSDPAYGVVRNIHEKNFIQLDREDLKRAQDESVDETLQRVMASEMEREFDLENGPLFKARLISIGPQDYVLLLTMHHSIGDAWSQDVLFQDLSRLYRRRRLGLGEPRRKSIRFADYARWYEDCVDAGLFKAELDYWARKLERRTFVQLPLDRPLQRPYPRLEDLTADGGIVPILWPAELADAVHAIARREHVTPFVVLLTAYALTFSGLLKLQRVPITNVTAGRHLSAARRVIGPFLNEVMVCVEVSPGASLAQLLKCVSKELRESLANGAVHADTVVDRLQTVKRIGEAHPIPVLEMRQIAFDLVNSAQDSSGLLELDGVECEQIECDSSRRRFTTPCEILTMVYETVGRIRGEVWYMRDLFDRATIEGVLAAFRTTLDRMTRKAGNVNVQDLLEEVERAV